MHIENALCPLPSTLLSMNIQEDVFHTHIYISVSHVVLKHESETSFYKGTSELFEKLY